MLNNTNHWGENQWRPKYMDRYTIYCAHGVENSIFLICQFSPNQSVDLTQFIEITTLVIKFI